MIVIQLITYEPRESADSAAEIVAADGEQLVRDIREVSTDDGRRSRKDLLRDARRSAALLVGAVEMDSNGATLVEDGPRFLELDLWEEARSLDVDSRGAQWRSPRETYRVVTATPARCRKPRACVKVAGEWVDLADFVRVGLGLTTDEIVAWHEAHPETGSGAARAAALASDMAHAAE